VEKLNRDDGSILERRRVDEEEGVGEERAGGKRERNMQDYF